LLIIGRVFILMKAGAVAFIYFSVVVDSHKFQVVI